MNQFCGSASIGYRANLSRIAGTYVVAYMS